MASKREKQWDKEQEEFRTALGAEPLTLMIAIIRRTISREARALEDHLKKAGLTTLEREAIYKELNKRRKEMEAELDMPGAYGVVKAEAETMGLLEVPEVSAP